MNPLFTGCATALVTPFLPDGSLDLTALRCLIALQLEAGIDALVLLGTTGEPSTLTMQEREIIIQTAIEFNPQIPIIVGTGSNDTRKAIEYARQAKRLGAHGQLCVTPYYNKTTQQGLVRHYTAIMDACDLPMIFYNVPGRTGMSITAKTVSILSQHPHAAGIKEASGSIEFASEIMQESTLPLYAGNDDLIVSLMAMGALGAVSVCSNILPIQTRAITHACLAGCFDDAREMQMHLLPLIKLLFSQISPIPLKAAMNMMGQIHDVFRLPLTSMEGSDRIRLKEMLQSMELIT